MLKFQIIQRLSKNTHLVLESIFAVKRAEASTMVVIGQRRFGMLKLAITRVFPLPMEHLVTSFEHNDPRLSASLSELSSRIAVVKLEISRIMFTKNFRWELGKRTIIHT